MTTTKRFRHIVVSIHLCMVFILSSLQLFADNSTTIAEANQAYSEGNYGQAIDLYQQVIEQEFEAPELYYNLGNAYFKNDDLPQAILNYERARKLAPNDDDINFNLKLAKLKTIDKVEAIPPLFFRVWWNDLAGIFITDTWSMISIILFWLCIAFFSLFIISNTALYKKMLFWISISLLVCTILSNTFAHQRYKEVTGENEAIVFSASVIIKSSPDESGTDLFVLHEGTKVLILDEVGMWRKIKLADGNVGWLNAKTIEII